MPRQPEFAAEARIPDSLDSVRGNVPDWCDLELTVTQIEDDGDTEWVMPMTRAAGEAVTDAIREVLHPWAGMSIIEHIWAALDEAMEAIMDPDEEMPVTDQQRGYALGLATSLAYLYNPIEPNVDAIREEARERWEQGSGD